MRFRNRKRPIKFRLGLRRYLEGLFVKGGIHIRFSDRDQGLADIVQSREVRGCLNRVNNEGDVNLNGLK